MNSRRLSIFKNISLSSHFICSSKHTTYTITFPFDLQWCDNWRRDVKNKRTKRFNDSWSRARSRLSQIYRRQRCFNILSTSSSVCYSPSSALYSFRWGRRVCARCASFPSCLRISRQMPEFWTLVREPFSTTTRRSLARSARRSSNHRVYIVHIPPPTYRFNRNPSLPSLRHSHCALSPAMCVAGPSRGYDSFAGSNSAKKLALLVISKICLTLNAAS